MFCASFDEADAQDLASSSFCRSETGNVPVVVTFSVTYLLHRCWQLYLTKCGYLQYKCYPYSHDYCSLLTAALHKESLKPPESCRHTSVTPLVSALHYIIHYLILLALIRLLLVLFCFLNCSKTISIIHVSRKKRCIYKTSTIRSYEYQQLGALYTSFPFKSIYWNETEILQNES